MTATSQPPVSIITPVYNGEKFLAECVESVLAQAYANWDYTIVNNCSTDRTLAIARQYAARDSRIRVVNNAEFLSILENHNHAIRQISPASKYCKFIFADDWLFPACLEEMVRVAEANPSVGLVGAYTTDGRSVRWHGPPYPSHCISGREICRSRLLGGPYVFGTMTSLLVRSDLIRKRPAFFNTRNLQADLEVCFDLLQESDFAFVHQVLTFGREQEGTNDSFAASLNSHRLADFVLFLQYGPSLLTDSEFRRHLQRLRRQYHRVLAHNVLRLRPREFWKCHEEILASQGARIDRWLLARMLFVEFATQLSHPVGAFKRGRRWWSSQVRRSDAARVESFQRLIRKEAAHGR